MQAPSSPPSVLRVVTEVVAATIGSSQQRSLFVIQRLLTLELPLVFLVQHELAVVEGLYHLGLRLQPQVAHFVLATCLPQEEEDNEA